ncbi:MAG TPA: hypothetical protein VFY18_09720 [Candidatus Limnocylindrales bacterium]|nr:hypothetical protein [Candidatus Limnocylindrales bacterium]
MTTSNTDAELADAVGRLRGAGFEQVSDQRGVAFDNRTIELVRGPIRVQLDRERGRLFLLIMTPVEGTFRDFGVWASCIDRQNPDLEPRTLRDDVASFVARLHELEILVATVEPDTLLDCLKAAGRWRFEERRRRGLITSPYGT